ncbi:GTPase or GTP-binding protein-like protein [Methanocaldococcus vulcanius M7]|uniref:polynucleotide 5'-hydroxyl-kinase n=1 Tax=Methanocaldococcus vulcanius (strain ATCC 700851 / DSM 12094 / M7) TaxID=579137 RepID=C9RHK6_METVM|nr:Clp1/GlmU family protein [Methanocaldococcus vulcanius]ACX73058.1 GTPase or GTP-binding protein-like protein [Methanocaldococcus vulcanius M7]
MITKANYPDDIPESRIELLELIKEKLSEKKKERDILKIIILGGLDSGKTTLTAFLSKELLNLGYKVAILDCDVGQKSILPPATISLGILNEKFEELHNIKPYKSYFIGSTTPIQFFGEMIVGIKRLCDLAEELGVEVVIIDTTGLIFGSGFDLKRMKIELINPNIIVGLEKEGELKPLLDLFKNKYKIVKLKVYDYAKSFSREERRKIRLEKWREYFKDSRSYEIKITINLTGSKVFQGKEISEEEKYLMEALFKWKVFYGSKCEGKYTVVKRDLEEIPRKIDKNVLYYLEPEKFEDIIVGLIDERGFCIDIGILKEIDFENKVLKIISPIDEELLKDVKEIRIGRLKIVEDGDEYLLDRDYL